MQNPKLFMLLLGCRPPGRNTEQHDIFFGIADTLRDLVLEIRAFWPDGKGLHIDAYVPVDRVGKYEINVVPRTESAVTSDGGLNLYFINLGGYEPPEFEEYHRKLLIVAQTVDAAILEAKKDPFYQRGQKIRDNARSHVDDKMLVDEVIRVQDQLPKHQLVIKKSPELADNKPTTHIGYLPLSRV